MLRRRARGVGGRADPVGAHPPRAARPARDRRHLAVQLHRRPGRRASSSARSSPGCRSWSATARCSSPAPGDALAREPLAELLPRFVPQARELAASLTGTAPAFSSAKAGRLLGWTAKRSWRTELA
ncbi:hypothetical protein [Actinomadura madurae]|uniref:hypothetical protein n=1 Tax=Actinomadura madurae TaxID=1993 RepID=UPI0020D24FD8|nr:hypothetical protein [Actinomadura madurae]MCQ0014291.1 hypothetical protein [Actinomadura madurae]